jgi:hypothetical protein
MSGEHSSERLVGLFGCCFIFSTFAITITIIGVWVTAHGIVVSRCNFVSGRIGVVC